MQSIRIKIFISFSLICFLWNCTFDKEQPSISKESEGENIRRVKPPEKYYTDFNSEECKQQIDSAILDAKNGKLVYEDSKGSGIVRYDDEIEEILIEYGILYKKTGPNCTLHQQCYGFFMDSLIRQKFGEDFIKKMEQRADSLFLSRWETKVYDYWDIDTKPSFKEGTPEIFIKKRIQLPKNWDTIPIKFERQYVSVDVFISNKGELTKWEFGERYNLKKSNEQFLNEIEKEISKVMQNMDFWVAGKLADKDVNSRINLDINLDEER